MKFTNYELIKKQSIPELKSEGYLLRHKKSGARVVLLSNDDENKVFTIGFRTPPENSKGVQHIIEHSVLCGSKLYPAKDPFVELVKGSLNTFLNAITYPEKTIYPIASCNDTDFQNLMHVYVDAVFNPNIYERKQIFMQEGWHYELENEDDELKYNGVVYNEMKGAYSSPDEVLNNITLQTLFPDTCYSKDSGGRPDVITDLSYEEFLEYHRTHYHPSNSYIYLYGNMDMDEKLEFLDREYLSKYDAIEVDTEIKSQPQAGRVKEVTGTFSVTEGDTDTKSYLSYNVLCGNILDKELYLAMQMLDYALLSSSGAPLKQALIDAGIGSDVYGSYLNIKQPVYSIIAKDADEKDKDRFVKIIKDTLRELADNGIDKNSLLAGINYFEFKYREADFGQFPKGLMYGIQAFDSWLYDDNEPFMHIQANDTIEFLKNNVDSGYFENIIKKYLLDEDNLAIVVLNPEESLTKKQDDITKAKLADYKKTLSKEQIQEIIDNTKALKKYQEEPSTKEELMTIPLLKREDIRREAAPLYVDERDVNGVKVIYSDVYTNGIGYLKLTFNTQYVPDELVPYAGLLRAVLGDIDTDRHSYFELSNEIDMNTGGIGFVSAMYPNVKDYKKYVASIEVSAKSLYAKQGFVFDTIEEIINHSKFDDEKRLLEIINEVKSRLQSAILSSGHTLAVKEAASYYSEYSYYSNLTGGIEYYNFITDIQKNYDKKKDEIIANLKKVAMLIFKKENLTVSYTADEDGYKEIPSLLTAFIEKLNTVKAEKVVRNFNIIKKNEGFMTPSQVQYVARCGNFINHGYQYTGALKILKLILSYDYLWINVRVKGGAYGCMSSFGKNGELYLVSYRDPNLKETNEIYEKTADYIRNFDVDERDMTKYIIGTMSEMDTPLTPSAKGSRSYTTYMNGISYEDIQKEREEILTANKEDIRNLAGIVESVMKDDYLCVVGSEGKIKENKDMFLEIKNLL